MRAYARSQRTLGALAALLWLPMSIPACTDEEPTAAPAVSVGETDGGGVPGSARPSPGINIGGRVFGAGGEDADHRPEPDPDAGSAADTGVSLPADCRPASRPIDVILVVDTSGSMQQEIVAIQDNINHNFARILDAHSIDYRLVLLADYGLSDATALRICISPPLSASDCAPLAERPQNGERFFHYSTTVSSLDPLCQVLDSFALPDTYNLAPNGWQQWLRPEALKVFVVVTDDSAGCASGLAGAIFAYEDDPMQVAIAFDNALLALDAIQFDAGGGQRNYKWYSIVGLSEEAAPGEPLVPEPCGTAPTPGLPYQALSNLTQAQRYPVCEGRSFPRAFRTIAAEVAEEALCQ